MPHPPDNPQSPPVTETKATPGPDLEAAFLAAAARSSEDAIIGITPDFTVRFWNAGAQALYGYHAEEVLGQPFALLVPEVGRQEHARYKSLLESSGQAVTSETVRRRADGSLVDVSVRVSPVSDAAGVLLGYCSIARDISGQRRAAAALRDSEARYRSLIDATAQIVWTNTAEGEMTGLNAAWGNYTGQTEGEYQDFGWALAVHPEDAQPTVDAWREAVAARRPFLFEHRLRRHDGVYRTFNIRAVPVLEDDGTIREWVGVHTDVTEQRQAEGAREALQAQQRTLLRDVLSSVTEGKLLLSNSPAQLPPPLTPVGEPIRLTLEGGLRGLRLRAQEAARVAGHSEERQHDLLTAVSEAGMNAIVHGGGGTGWVSVGEDGTVQVRVEDHGKGIAMEHLPRATLSRGFTTAGTLGHGLKMMLETADRLSLLTGPGGTTLVLEQERESPLPAWL